MSDEKNTRIDTAHAGRPAASRAPLSDQVVRVEAASALPLAAPSLAPAPAAEGHAGQLAKWLQTRSRELQGRAQQLDSQEADLEAKVAAARNALEAERAALETREAALERPAADPALLAQIAAREKDLDTREANLDHEVSSLARSKAAFGEKLDSLDRERKAVDERAKEFDALATKLADESRDQQRAAAELELRHAELRQLEEHRKEAEVSLNEREHRLALRHQEIETALKRYEKLDATERRVAELEEQLAASAERDANLAIAERLVADERAALARRLADVERREAEIRLRNDRDRTTLGADREVWRVEAKAAAQRTDRREGELDRRAESLRRLQTELENTQREVLEMRLATEETWAQLTGVLAPATLTKSIARVRGQLADHYGHTLQKIADERGALREAAAQINAEFKRLESQRLTLTEWANRRHEEFGDAADRLEGREHELDRQQRQFEKLEVRWAAERQEYRDQIRNLLAELRGPELKVHRAA
ncbi:hypothetical protein Pla108_32860 [Botrimarina colliarenosi]|uniref:Uncharacterized protein n=1 Tax=Botrimarina colliarenosi TaxID=2528001 RepID=A0A5C6AA58_9BACT|nr:hypothetical protein [Botrimarina colliarenosi]TWT96198.1 hypothetical protein Pla108_32860 [Botrimarina colliarenosi]